MKILVLSDTHIPRLAQDLPPQIYDELRDIDMIFHAGDFVEFELYEKLVKAKKLHAVCGNMDSQQLKNLLSTKEIVMVGKFNIGLIHGYGSSSDMIETVGGEFSDVDAIVFGHSHIATNITKNGVLFFNPGSPTDTVFTRERSYGILEVGAKSIEGRIIKVKET